MRQKTRWFAVILMSLALVATSFFVLTPRSAEATCWECTYIAFVGNTCNIIGGNGGSGRTQCIQADGGCHLAGSVCSVAPKPGIIIKERP